MAWQEATIETISRLQSVLALAPKMSEEQRARLYTEARIIALAQSDGRDSTRFWGVFVNVLRILVAADSGHSPDKSIFETPRDEREDRSVMRQCPKVKRNGVRCVLNTDHTGAHDFPDEDNP